MKPWFFRISQDEIIAVAEGLFERHGEGAHAEARRLADVGRRMGARRNSKLFRCAAQRLADDGRPVIAPSPPTAWLAKVRESVARFGAPRIAADEKAPL